MSIQLVLAVSDALKAAALIKENNRLVSVSHSIYYNNYVIFLQDVYHSY